MVRQLIDYGAAVVPSRTLPLFDDTTGDELTDGVIVEPELFESVETDDGGCGATVDVAAAAERAAFRASSRRARAVSTQLTMSTSRVLSSTMNGWSSSLAYVPRFTGSFIKLRRIKSWSISGCDHGLHLPYFDEAARRVRISIG